jgi:hypothetical protein
VLDKGAPVKSTQFFDMGKANPNFVDTKGRKWPGEQSHPFAGTYCLAGVLCATSKAYAVEKLDVQVQWVRFYV